MARPWQSVAVLTAIALAIRLWFVLVWHPLADFIYSDMKMCFDTARTFSDPNHVWEMWDTVKPRAMPYTGGLLLRWFKKDGLTAWGILQATLSGLTVPLAFVALRRWFGLRAALVGCAFFVVDYLSISFAGFLMAETYLIFFLALSAALLDPKRPFLALLSGLALGVSCLYKAQPTTLVPLWCLALFFSGGARSLQMTKQRWSAVLFGVGVLLAVVPESVFASHIMGRPVFLSTYGGQNVYVGHCEAKMLTCEGGPEGYFNSGVPKYYQRDKAWPDVGIRVAVFDSAYYTREGWRCYTQSFGFAVRWSLEQLADVFAGWPGSTIDPWPNAATKDFPLTRLCNLLMAYLFAPLAFWALWRGRRRLNLWLGFGLPMASVFLVAEMFSGDPRYRMPFDFFILGAASVSIVRLCALRRARRIGKLRQSNSVAVASAE